MYCYVFTHLAQDQENVLYFVKKKGKKKGQPFPMTVTYCVPIRKGVIFVIVKFFKDLKCYNWG